MNTRRHLLITSITFMAFISSEKACSSMLIENDTDINTLVGNNVTKIDKYVFKDNIVYFENPRYKANKRVEKKLGIETVKTVEITNGSALNFTAKGGAGDIIRAFSQLREVPNPYGISHSGFVVNLDPREMYHTVLEIMPGGDAHTDASLSAKAGRAILRELEKSHKSIISAVKFPKVKASFAIESYGSADEVLHGIAPHVHIRDLRNRIIEYDGNVFIRPLYTEVSHDVTMDFMNEYLGRPYEKLATLNELLGSVTQSNTEERIENVFCSELVSLFYKKGKVFDDDIISNNVIPELLSSGAGDEDLLLGKALDDIPLKLSFTRYHSDKKNEEVDPSCSIRCLYRIIMQTILCCNKQNNK